MDPPCTEAPTSICLSFVKKTVLSYFVLCVVAFLAVARYYIFLATSHLQPPLYYLLFGTDPMDT
jgi:hypothetical protein